MNRRIKKAAVIGSGVMGSGIAAHLVNVGIQTILLDIVPRELSSQEQADKEARNRFAQAAVEKMQKQKPAPLTSKKNLSLLSTGNLEDNLLDLQDADWIIEVVVENLEVKKQLFVKVDAVRKQESIISSNTSGISVEKMIEGRSTDFKKHFLGTHFFNPPRYLKLLEIIPTSETNEEVVTFMKDFAENVLGKGVVIAKDTPNFIANRIGTYGLLITVQAMLQGGYSVGEVDSVTGPLIGRAKSATFRTLDVVGLDTFVHVANNVYNHVQKEKEKASFAVPNFMKEMLEKGRLGSKSGQGFFLKQGKDILELNPITLEYEPRKKLTAPSIELAKTTKGLSNRMKTLLYAGDRAGVLLWNIISPVLLYAAQLHKEIADDIVSVDRGMKWGFGWELGPFEIWDAIGLEKSIARLEAEGKEIPDWVKELLAQGNTSFYKSDNGVIQYYDNGAYKILEENKRNIQVKRIKEQYGVIKKNAGASLIDIGDDVALLEFHSKSNSIGLDILQMINESIMEVSRNYKGLVIGNQGKNFCVGANLAMMLMEAMDENYFELEFIVKQFQDTMMKIKYSDKPVVAAPFAMTLGGGTEICLPSASIQAASETYMGLVEVGVGLIPGGGGNKELYLKHLEQVPVGVEIDYVQVASNVFETIAMAKVSTSAQEAKEQNFLCQGDGISVNGDHLLYDAKQKVIVLYENGYRAPLRKGIPVAGETGYGALQLGAQSMFLSGYLSDHDMKIAKKLAYVLSGGTVPYGTEVDEQYLLDIEREAFLSLVSEPKSQMRMQHMLAKGKPLRN